MSFIVPKRTKDVPYLPVRLAFQTLYMMSQNITRRGDAYSAVLLNQTVLIRHVRQILNPVRKP